jgi:hypothetical protein
VIAAGARLTTAARGLRARSPAHRARSPRARAGSPRARAGSPAPRRLDAAAACGLRARLSLCAARAVRGTGPVNDAAAVSLRHRAAASARSVRVSPHLRGPPNRLSWVMPPGAVLGRTAPAVLGYAARSGTRQHSRASPSASRYGGHPIRDESAQAPFPHCPARSKRGASAESRGAAGGEARQAWGRRGAASVGVAGVMTAGVGAAGVGGGRRAAGVGAAGVGVAAGGGRDNRGRGGGGGRRA